MAILQLTTTTAGTKAPTARIGTGIALEIGQGIDPEIGQGTDRETVQGTDHETVRMTDIDDIHTPMTTNQDRHRLTGTWKQNGR